MAAENTKSKSLLRSLLIYLFLLYLSFVVADLVLLKFVRPQFSSRLTSKDKLAIRSALESDTGSYEISEIGSKDSYTEKIVKRNIFNSKEMPVPIARLKGDDKVEDELEDNDPVLTNLEINLQGTAVHRNPFRSLATLEASGKTLSYTVGDEIPGMAEIVSVVRKKVIFRNLRNKRLEYAEISRDQVQPKRSAPKRVTRTRVKPLKSSLVKRNGNRFTAKRSDVEKQLSNLGELVKQANSRPFRDPATGELLGYQVFGIDPNSLIAQIGIENNDVIREINGVKISNPAKALSLFNQLKTASEVTATVNRGGVDVDLEYNIED